jgi:hypothetical protein
VGSKDFVATPPRINFAIGGHSQEFARALRGLRKLLVWGEGFFRKAFGQLKRIRPHNPPGILECLGIDEEGSENEGLELLQKDILRDGLADNLTLKKRA